MKIKILIYILLTWLASFFFYSQSFAVSQDIKTSVKGCYDNPPSCEQAKEHMKEVVENEDKTEEEHLYALIYLAIFSLQENNVTQAKDFFCQIMELKSDFDPDLSVCDITEDFRKRFSVLKRQNSCPRVKQSCRGVKSFALKKQLKKCDALFNQGIINYDCFQEAEKICPNDPNVLELKGKIGACRIAAKKFTLCIKDKGKDDTSSCCREARASCPSHSEFLKKCLGKTEKGESKTTTKCEALEKRLQKCENNYTDTDKKTPFKKSCQSRLRRCQNLLDENAITTNKEGEGNEETALSCYQEAQHLCPTHSSDIQEKFQEMEERYIYWIDIYLEKKLYDAKKHEKVKNYLDGLRKVNPQSPDILKLEQRLQQLCGDFC